MAESINSSHYGLYGLSNCSGAGCARYQLKNQIAEVVVSGLVILWIVVEFVMQLRVRIRLEFSWQEVMLILVFLCLAFNICFMAWEVVLWYVMACLMNQLYFTTLVYYFAKKYMEKSIPETERKPYIIALLSTYAAFCLGQLGIFIFMVNSGKRQCKEITELAVNAVMISLGIIFFILAYQNQLHQKRKFEHYKVEEKVGPEQKVNSPLGTIWFWVLANIAGQIANEVESGLIYDYYDGEQCYPIQTNLEMDVLGPIFLALAYALPFCSTLWFYRQRRIQTQQRNSKMTQVEMAAQVDVENRIEIIHDFSTSQGQKRSDLTEGLI